jgi:hypothetical protein
MTHLLAHASEPFQPGCLFNRPSDLDSKGPACQLGSPREKRESSYQIARSHIDPATGTGSHRMVTWLPSPSCPLPLLPQQ